MGMGDNRRSPKMRRKISQNKLKARIKRQRVAKAEVRAAAGGKKPAKKSK